MSTEGLHPSSAFAVWMDRFLERASNYLGALSVLLLMTGLATTYMDNPVSSRLIAGALVVIEVALVLSLIAALRWRTPNRRPSRLLIFFNIVFMLATTVALLAHQRGWLSEASQTVRQQIAKASAPPAGATYRSYDR